MLINVQVLRALAAFLVVFVHVQTLATLLGLPPTAFEFGNTGVDVFFVISGMIMVLTTRRRHPTAREFMLNRIARIAPFYWAMTFLVFGLALAAPAAFASTQADIAALLKSLFFIPFERPDGKMFPLVFVGWTLNYEMAFYALFALGLLFKNPRLGFTITLAALTLVVVLGLALRPGAPLARFYTAPLMLEFALGMLIGAAVPRLRPGAVPRPLVLSAAVLAFAFMLRAPSVWSGAERLLIAGLPAAVIVLCAVYLEKAGWSFKSRAAILLGDASFATYLTHIFVTQAVIKGVAMSGPTQPAMLVSAIFVTFILVAITGGAAHLLVERPLSLWTRNLLLPDRRRSADQAPTRPLADAGRSEA